MFRSLWQKMTCRKARLPERTRRAKPSRVRQKKVSLEIQALEDRCLPTVLMTPVFGAEQLAPTPIGDYHYQTLSSPSVYLIFWGTYWNNNGSQVQTTVNDFQTIMSSPFTSGLTRYGSDGKAFYGGYYKDLNSDPPAGFNSHDSSQAGIIQTEIGNVINQSSGIPAPPFSGDAIYVVITSNVNNGGGNGSYNAPGVYQAGIFLLPMSMISVGYDGNRDDTNVVFAHELAEAMSDPSGNTFGVRVAPTASPPPGRGGGQICDWEPGEYGYRLGGPGGIIVPSYWYNAIDNSGNFTFGGNCMVPDGNSQQLVLQAVLGSWSQDNTGTIVFNHHYDLTIRGDQLGQNYNDALTLSESAAGLQVILNGESFFFDANIDIIDHISVDLGGGNDTVNVESTQPGVPVTINEGSGTDTVNISPSAEFLDSIKGDVIVNGGSGVDTLNVYDYNDSFNGDVWTITGSSITRNGAATIFYNLQNNINITGGTGNLTYNILSTESGGPFINGGPTTNLDTGPGTDTVNVLSTASGGTLNINNGFSTTNHDTVNIGSNAPSLGGTLANIAGAVSVSNSSGGGTTLNVDDSGDTTGQTVTVTNGSISGTWSGAPINYTGGQITALNIFGGSGGNIFNVQSTAAGTTTSIDADHTATTSNNSVYIGSSAPSLGGTLANIAGAVNVSSTSGGTYLTVDDSGDSANHTVDMYDGALHGLAPADITWTPNASGSQFGGVNALRVLGSTGSNTFNVHSTSALYHYTWLNGTGGGSSAVNVQSTQPNADGIHYALYADGGSGFQTVTIGSLAPSLGGTVANIKGTVLVYNSSGSGSSGCSWTTAETAVQRLPRLPMVNSQGCLPPLLAGSTVPLPRVLAASTC